MAIRMRRGNYADFDPSRMVAGEFAVCLDNGYVFITLAPNNVVQLGTAETIEEALELCEAYMETSQAYAIGMRGDEPVPSTDPAYHNNSKYYAENIGDTAHDSEAFALGTIDGQPVPSSDPRYHNNSKYYSQQSAGYYEYVHEAVETHDPEFAIDWSTGNLQYTGGYFTFWIDSNGFLKWGIENP